jgi:hypothetical protein
MSTPDRDLQRRSLRDLIALATQCAAEDLQIEQQKTDAELKLREAIDKADWLRDERRKQQLDAIQEKHNLRKNEILERVSTDEQAITTQHKQAQRKTEHEFDSVASEAKQKQQQAIWLAESVQEASTNQARDDFKKTRAKVEAAREELDGLQTQALQALTDTGYSPVDFPVPPTDAIELGSDADAAYTQHREAFEKRLGAFKALSLPRLVVGAWPFLIVVGIVIGSIILTGQIFGETPPGWLTWGPVSKSLSSAISVGAIALLLSVGAMIGLKFLAAKQVREGYAPVQFELALTRKSTEAQLTAAEKLKNDRKQAALELRNVEVNAVNDKINPILHRATQKRDGALDAAKREYSSRLHRLYEWRDRHLAEVEASIQTHLAELDEKLAADTQNASSKHADQATQVQSQHTNSRTALDAKWREGLHVIQSSGAGATGSFTDFATVDWNTWNPPKEFARTVPFGQMRVDLREVVAGVVDVSQFRLHLPEVFTVPAMLAFPDHASLMIDFDRSGRVAALHTLQSVMAKLLTSLPAGRVRFTIIDPIGLGQNFAGFMHLADYDEALVGGRIWTDADHIEQRLTDLTEHMETVIQKYLRNEFATIDDYNAQAGELAEPYRYLVVADFPTNVSEDAMKRLASIASTGARCGVFTLVARDIRTPLPTGAHLEDLSSRAVHLVQQQDHFVWQDEVFKRFPLTLDSPPDEQTLTRMLHVVGTYAKDANRVEVPFETIAPDDDKIWSGDCTNELRVPIGRVGATRQQFLRLGKGVAQHTLIAGKTGSGKSTLLHVLATNIALWYSPEQVELYLIDFKKGVEFKTYASNLLPHARAIAVESDREFGLSVLQRLDAELTRRGELFRSLGVQDLASYRATPNAQVMPRTLLVIDEFQEFFSEDDKLAQDAAALIDRLVRQGRAFGIHVLLGSQTISGSSGLPRSTIGQMAVRIALQCSEADSHLILGDNNAAARLLSRPGEAIYNDVGGLVEGNSPFQISWLSDDLRDKLLTGVRDRYEARGNAHLEPIVFEGNAPADVTKSKAFMLGDVPLPKLPTIYLGEPVAIRPPSHIVLRRQSGANVLIIGQQDEIAQAIMAMTVVSLGMLQAPETATIYLLDGTPADSVQAGVLPAMLDQLPQTTQSVEYRIVPEIINSVAKELERRQAADETEAAPIFILIHGLQRYRSLRKSEDSFSFSSSDEDKPPATDKQFADILRDGPNFGIHVIAWSDTAATLDRTFDRSAMREFDNRVLMQMSATDSSNLMDSPAANKLGMFRALLYSEEQGVMEKFRPYAVPASTWIEALKTKSRR